jgi:hypothetical protein
MKEFDAGSSYRAHQNRYHALDNRARRYMGAVFGLMGYSAVSNFFVALAAIVSAATQSTASLLDAVISLVLGGLYTFGALRVWLKDDTRWWPVAVPACVTLALSVLSVSVGRPVIWPFVINIVLLALVPLRKRAEAAAIANQPPSVADAFAPAVSAPSPPTE